MKSLLLVNIDTPPTPINLSKLIALLKDEYYHFDVLVFDAVSFIHLIRHIVLTYSIDESYIDVIRKSLNNNFYKTHLSFSSFDLSFAVLDYLYSKYAETKLKNCTILHLLYMYDFEIFIFNSTYINYFFPMIANDNPVPNQLEDIDRLALTVADFTNFYSFGSIDKIYLDAVKLSLPTVSSWKILEFTN